MANTSILPRLPNLSTLNSPAIFENTLERNLLAAEFYKLCCAYPDYRFEKTLDGKLVVSTPLGLDEGFLEGEIIGILSNWRRATKTGISLSASPCFKLPDGSFHSASSTWISNEKLAILTPEQRKRFAPIVPDFIIEVHSSSARIARLKKKIREVWIKNGVRLGWLIDPVEKKAYIYRQDGSVDTIPDFNHTLSGEDVCVGFELDLRKLQP